MNLVSSWLFKRAVKKNLSELAKFCDQLHAMTPYQLGFLVAVATHMRNELADTALPFMAPFSDVQKSIIGTYKLTRLVRLYQAKNETLDAQAATVWVQTFRAATMPGLDLVAREMWRELSRGFSSVDVAAAQIVKLTYKLPLIHGYDQYPLGLEPSHL